MQYGAQVFNHTNLELRTWGHQLREAFKPLTFVSPLELLASAKSTISDAGVPCNASLRGGFVDVYDAEGLVLRFTPIQ